MPLALPRFYAIIDRSLRPELQLEEIVGVLSGAGVRLVQLRDKRASSRSLWAMAQELHSLLPADTTLLINDRADVAQLISGAGVHVGARDLPAEAARHILGPGRIIGLSTHNRSQVMVGEKRPVDYLGFGPIFSTRSKEDAEAVVGSEGLREARAVTEKPLVAIGGITPENVAEVRAAGADAVAVLRGWLGAADLAGRLEEFRQALGGLD